MGLSGAAQVGGHDVCGVVGEWDCACGVDRTLLDHRKCWCCPSPSSPPPPAHPTHQSLVTDKLLKVGRVNGTLLL